MLRVDDIGFGSLKLFQDTEAFCYGIDSVLLADFASKRNGKSGNVIDLGTGNGAVALIMSHKMPEAKITGIEVQREQAELAARTMKENGLEERVRIICSDIKDISKDEYGKYDLVTCNPPYVKQGAGMKSGNIAKMTARHEMTATISDFVKTAAMLMDDNGRAVFVYRPSRLEDLFKAVENAGLSISELQMVCPYADRNANIVLAGMTKKKANMNVLPQIVVRDENKNYTEEIQDIYERHKKT